MMASKHKKNAIKTSSSPQKSLDLTQNETTGKENLLKQILVIIIPAIVFVLHSILFWDYIIDDAAIGFAYARNLAEGYGLVQQPGFPPVEGYSNFIWIMLFVPFFPLGLFDPVITPKILSILIVIISFFVIYKSFSSLFGKNSFRIFFILLFLSINTSFVIWTTSGLENPLYVLLLSLILFYSIQTIVFDKMTHRNAIILGLLAAFAALTRPEGILFFGIYPLLWLIRLVRKRKFVKSDSVHLLVYILSFVIVFGSFILFRFSYFGEIFPNTYYMKGSPTFKDVFAILTFQIDKVRKVEHLMTSVGGKYGNLLLIILSVITICMVSGKKLKFEHFILFIFLFFAFSIFLLLPYDWMAEFRFATLFFVFFYAFAVAVIDTLLKNHIPKPSDRLFLIILITAVFTGGSFFMFKKRSIDFKNNPTTPMWRVKKLYSDKFNEYAKRLSLKNATVLLPDIGAMLYYSNLKVYDLGGLCDKTIAKTVSDEKPVFYNYVFETLKPTFIHMHGKWTALSFLDSDKRFRRDYLAINEKPDDWVKEKFGVVLNSGDYIRKEVVTGNNVEILNQIRQEFYASN